MDVIIGTAGFERVGVRLEFLADRVALALQRFAMLGRQSDEGADPQVDGGDGRVVPVEVTGLAGAVGSDADVVGDRRWAAVAVNALDERCAFLFVEEIADDEQVEQRRRDAPNPGRAAQSLGGGGRIRARSRFPVRTGAGR